MTATFWEDRAKAVTAAVVEDLGNVSKCCQTRVSRRDTFLGGEPCASGRRCDHRS